MREISSDQTGSVRPIDTASVEAILVRLDDWTKHAIPSGSVNVLFVDDETCSQLHADYFGDPEVTDVMTFPGDEEDDHAGDIAICPGYAALSAHEFGTSLEEELTLYLIHAWLHLSGMEDATEAGRAAMRIAEKEALAWIGDLRLRF